MKIFALTCILASLSSFAPNLYCSQLKSTPALPPAKIANQEPFAFLPSVGACSFSLKTVLPDVDATGAIIIEMDSGRVLYEKNADQPLAMASTTKIMTAIMVLENADLDDIVTVSKRAASAPKVKMDLTAGEEIPLRGLLHALMLQSSNDAAVAIAEHVGGTVEDFCARMTTYAHSLGAVSTIFETPSGLDAGNHQSTAADLAILTQYALKNPQFVELINTPEFVTVSNKRTYNIYNKNRLLNEYQGALGVKTGFTNKAGHCFVGAAKRDDMQLISVVLASGWGAKGKEQKWVDTKRLLNYGFENYEIKEVLAHRTPAGTLNVERTKTPQIELFYDASVTLPLHKNGEDIKITAHFPELVKAPVLANDVVGEGYVYVNGELFATVPIQTASHADRHDLKTSMEKVIRAFLKLGTSQEINIVLPEF